MIILEDFSDIGDFKDFENLGVFELCSKTTQLKFAFIDSFMSLL
jgi:hypothetical protein